MTSDRPKTVCFQRNWPLKFTGVNESKCFYHATSNRGLEEAAFSNGRTLSSSLFLWVNSSSSFRIPHKLLLPSAMPYLHATSLSLLFMSNIYSSFLGLFMLHFHTVSSSCVPVFCFSFLNLLPKPARDLRPHRNFHVATLAWSSVVVVSDNIKRVLASRHNFTFLWDINCRKRFSHSPQCLNLKSCRYYQTSGCSVDMLFAINWYFCSLCWRRAFQATVPC